MRRASEIATLTRLLRETDKPGLKIAAVVGPGGVGKSYLLEEVFRREDPRSLGYLHLSVDASNSQTRADFFGLLDGLAPRSLPEPARSGSDYFPQFRKVAAIHRALVEDVSAELERSKVPEEVRAAVASLFRTGLVLNESIPITRKVINIAKSGLDDKKAVEALDSAWETVVKLAALRESTFLPGPVRDLLGATKKNRVKRDLYNYTADALCSDLAAMLVGYRRRDTLKFTQQQLEGSSRLLIVLDDFEATAPVLGEFLLGALLPRLAKAPYPSLVLIAGRDDLEAIHPGFGQHAKRWLADEMRLTSFDRQSAGELLTERGIPADRHDSIYASTQGFPFLLSLVIEEEGAPDAESALFAKKFFDRTTRWMTERERSWFTALCYLDVVNEDTIPFVVEGASVQEVERWFEGEASIRDPFAPAWTVRPLIREKALRYLSTRSPSTHRSMVERARPSNDAPSVGVC
jgi:hypothetical protein